MTDTTTTQTPTTQSSDTTPVATAAPQTQVSKDAPAHAGSTEPSSSTSSAGQAAPKDPLFGAKDSDPATAKQDGTSDPKPGKDASEAEKPKDGEGKEGQEAEKPIEYQPFTLPEGLEMDADALAAATPVFQKLKATQEDAQSLVNMAGTVVSKTVKHMNDEFAKQVTKWHDATVSEFGKEGEQVFKEKTAVAQRAINKIFSEEERASLSHYGFGNFPGIFRMAHALGMALGEDTGANNTSGAGTGKEDKTLAEIWYPQKEA